MIWLVLALAPVAIALIVGLIRIPEYVLAWLGLCVLVFGWTLLFCYGGWQLNWFKHCGTFWESYHCGG